MRNVQSITEAFLKHPQIALTILINAYDDGHSTGRLRRFIPGMLGPPTSGRTSIASCGNRMSVIGRCAFSPIIAFRPAWNMHGAWISRGASRARIGGRNHPSLPADSSSYPSSKRALSVRAFFQRFLQYAAKQDVLGNRFDFTDCALGNILFAGCYLEEQRDFNRTVDAFARFYEIESRLLNVTAGENLFLIARKQDGGILWSEAEIVSAQNPSKIDDIFLIEEQVYRVPRHPIE